MDADFFNGSRRWFLEVLPSFSANRCWWATVIPVGFCYPVSRNVAVHHDFKMAMKNFLLGTVAALAMVTSASAADLAARPYTKALWLLPR